MQLHAHRGRGAADRAQVRRLDARRGERARPGGLVGRARRSTRSWCAACSASPIARRSSRSPTRSSTRDPKAALRALHAAFEKGLDPRDLAEGLTEHIRHVLVLKVDPEGGDLVAGEPRGAGAPARAGRGLVRARSAAAAADRRRGAEPMRDSPQPLVHLEAAVLQMATLEPGETLARAARSGSRRSSSGWAARRRAAGAAATPPPRARVAAPRAGAAARARAAPARRRAPAPRQRPRAQRRGRARDRRSMRAARRATPRAARSDAAARRAPAPRADGVARRAATPARRRAATAVARRAGRSASTTTTERALAAGARRAINARKRMLGAFLEESRFLGRAGDALVLAMDDLHRAVIDEKENRAHRRRRGAPRVRPAARAALRAARRRGARRRSAPPAEQTSGR